MDVTFILVKRQGEFFLPVKTIQELFAAFLGWGTDEIRRAVDLGNAFAQARMAIETEDEERFRWAEKSAAQGERDGFYWVGQCYRDGSGCVKDAERAREYFLVSAELGDVYAMVRVGEFFDKDDPQRFVWFGRAASNGGSSLNFLKEMSGQIHNFSSETRNANVVFAIGRALKGYVDNESRTIFGRSNNFCTRIGPANQALHFYKFQLQSYRASVDSWTIVGLRNKVVKDIRKMIGKMIWDAREEAGYLERK